MSAVEVRKRKWGGTTGAVRQRYLADRLLLILMYSPDSANFQRTGTTLLFKPRVLTSKIKLGSSAIYDQLVHLEKLGYVTELKNPKYSWVSLRINPPRGMCEAASEVTTYA